MNTVICNYINPVITYCTENKCSGILSSTRYLKEHIFIETKVYADFHKFFLKEFPELKVITVNVQIIILITF